MKKYNQKIFFRFDRKTNTIITKLLILPISRKISLFFLNYTNFKPYQLTIMGLIIAIISSYFFANKNYIIGALIFQIALIFDSVDGYVARIKNNGSSFGIILDGYVDFIKIIINSLAIMYSVQYDLYISVLFVIFIIINLFDGSLDLSIKKCFYFLKNKKIKIYNFERKLLKIKSFLEKKGFRTIFYYTQERYFVVFFLAPIFNQINLFLLINLLITLFFLHIRIFLDLAMIKSQIKNNRNEELKYRNFV